MCVDVHVRVSERESSVMCKSVRDIERALCVVCRSLGLAANEDMCACACVCVCVGGGWVGVWVWLSKFINLREIESKK